MTDTITVKRKKSKRGFYEHPVVYTVVLVFFAIYAITLIYPLVWLFMESLRNELDFFWYPLSFTGNLSLESYSRVLGEYNVPEMFLNSAILAFGGTLTTLLVSSMAAYVVARYRFKGRQFIYTLVITTMIIPTTGSIAATYKLMSDIHFTGSYVGVILMQSGGFGFNFFLLYGFFKNISETYSEAAKIDGASNAKIFFGIMLPIARPSLLAVALITFIGLWNDYYTPYMFLRSHRTLAVGIYMIQSSLKNGGDYPGLFAIMILATVPIIVLFGIFQKQIMENTVAGGIKG